jgi:hypothetical protein
MAIKWLLRSTSASGTYLDIYLKLMEKRNLIFQTYCSNTHLESKKYSAKFHTSASTMSPRSFLPSSRRCKEEMGSWKSLSSRRCKEGIGSSKSYSTDSTSCRAGRQLDLSHIFLTVVYRDLCLGFPHALDQLLDKVLLGQKWEIVPSHGFKSGNVQQLWSRRNKLIGQFRKAQG